MIDINIYICCSLFCSNFFEKSRIPVEELRHIWQLCDVTRDGALSLSEFTAAMHLVVLRRNNIPLPSSLPHCLHPNVLAKSTTANTSASSTIPQEPPEADLLHLNDDDDDEHTDNTIISSTQQQQPKPRLNDKNIMNLSSISTSSQASNSSSRREVTTPVLKHRSISNSPNAEKSITAAAAITTGAGAAASSTNDASQWTKFSESPTTTATAMASGASATSVASASAAGVPAPAVSSPGLKPALFDMKRTAQDVGSNPQILHPVPLRVTPIGSYSTTYIDLSIMHLLIKQIFFPGTAIASSGDPSSQQGIADVEGVVVLREDSPKVIATTTAIPTATAAMSSSTTSATNSIHNIQRESNDLRAIQRPQAKKLPAKNNIGALPPPPQREPSIGSIGLSEPPDQATPLPPSSYATSVTTSAKKEPPPLPPPRPHRHARSSSLDLNKFKIGAAGAQQPEVS